MSVMRVSECSAVFRRRDSFFSRDAHDPKYIGPRAGAAGNTLATLITLIAGHLAGQNSAWGASRQGPRFVMRLTSRKQTRLPALDEVRP